MGLQRNLSTAEIVEQAVLARRLLSSEVGSITNVVFMVGVYLLSTYEICSLPIGGRVVCLGELILCIPDLKAYLPYLINVCFETFSHHVRQQ